MFEIMKHDAPSEMTPQMRARKCADLMFASDSASPGLGMAITDIGPGHATMTMTVRQDMLNGHRICHGGFIFTLADSAFAFACNSYNQLVVAQQNQITYLSPGKEGEVLTATATEASRSGRSGVYDVRVTGEDGRAVALFRGLSRSVKGQHFPEEETTE
ncbi:putative phenylacetic acid degredation protein [Sulfitobacter noctilucicola]|nr:putative phenylacetic acid degredation protein [Sulfitobacter noctilucicola]